MKSSAYLSKASLKFDEPTINSILNAYASSSNPISVINLFEHLTRHDYSNGQIEYFIPTKITYTILFTAISRAIAPVRMKLVKENDSISDLNFVGYETDDQDSEGLIEGIMGKSFNYDRLVRRLYKSMRFDYDIDVDHVMVSVLNKIFSIKQPSSGLFGNHHYESVLSKETARIICEDLIFSAWNPLKFEPIVNACEYPTWKLVKIMRNKPLRSKNYYKSASYKIFNKYGWNKVDSGWNSL